MMFPPTDVAELGGAASPLQLMRPSPVRRQIPPTLPVTATTFIPLGGDQLKLDTKRVGLPFSISTWYLPACSSSTLMTIAYGKSTRGFGGVAALPAAPKQAAAIATAAKSFRMRIGRQGSVGTNTPQPASPNRKHPALGPVDWSRDQGDRSRNRRVSCRGRPGTGGNIPRSADAAAGIEGLADADRCARPCARADCCPGALRLRELFGEREPAGIG